MYKGKGRTNSQAKIGYETYVENGQKHYDMRDDVKGATQKQQDYFFYLRGKFKKYIADDMQIPIERCVQLMQKWDTVPMKTILENKICDIGGLIFFCGMGRDFSDEVQSIAFNR